MTYMSNIKHGKFVTTCWTASIGKISGTFGREQAAVSSAGVREFPSWCWSLVLYVYVLHRLSNESYLDWSRIMSALWRREAIERLSSFDRLSSWGWSIEWNGPGPFRLWLKIAFILQQMLYATAQTHTHTHTHTHTSCSQDTANHKVYLM